MQNCTVKSYGFLQFINCKPADNFLSREAGKTIAQLNSDYRGIAAKTDVLSFSQLEGEAMPTVGGQLLGDIVISLPTAQAQAQEYGHSLAREVCYLAVHGLLHLLGADHGAQMRAREEEILQQVGLARHA